VTHSVSRRSARSTEAHSSSGRQGRHPWSTEKAKSRYGEDDDDSRPWRNEECEDADSDAGWGEEEEAWDAQEDEEEEEEAEELPASSEEEADWQVPELEDEPEAEQEEEDDEPVDEIAIADYEEEVEQKEQYPWTVARPSTSARGAAGKQRQRPSQNWRPSDVYNRRNDKEMEVVEEAPEDEPDETSAILPIVQKKDEIVPTLCHGPQVCCILGETGCGKSTQVPKFLLEEAAANGQPIRIAVTQPRRVAVLNLANRVSAELREDGPGATVGYRIGGESRPGEHIDFCTVGYLLQLFINSPEEFGRYTHIVLDEVHERSAESDMLCLVVRLFMSTCYKDTRVVVMSATLQSDVFADYFAGLTDATPSKVFVGAKRYHVQEYFLDELTTAYGGKLWTTKAINTRLKETFSEHGKKRLDTKHCEKMYSITLDVVQCIAEKGSTILVFLPGMAEISSLWEEARGLEKNGAFQVFPLHSMIPREEQEMVFAPPTRNVTRVVLATDIAESSITLPNVVAVVDMGLHRRVDYDGKRGMSALSTKWISRAAATQRSGRAGRTRPGICIRLYTREFYDEVMNPFEPPESQSMPLDRLYLQAKQLMERLAPSLGRKAPQTAEDLLGQLIQAPDISSIASARENAADLGVITEASERADITTLGRLCLQLPVELKMARLVWLGSLWGCAADAVVLASVLSSIDPFAAPSPLFIREEKEFAERLRASTSARLLFDGGLLSEPLMLRQLFLEWLAQFHKAEWVYGSKNAVFQARRRHTEDFSWHYSLSVGRMGHMINHVTDLALKMHRLCEPGCRADVQLRGLIRGLGYTVNNRGDLSGIDWNDWQPFSIEEVFKEGPAYLKSLIAANFGDQLLLGSYGNVPQSLQFKRQMGKDPAAKKLEQEANILEVMAKNNFEVRRSALFSNVKDLEDHLDFVCGEPPSRESVKVPLDGGGSATLVELNAWDASRWQSLESRASAPALESEIRLPPEFNLLYQYDKAIRDLTKAKVKEPWKHGISNVSHPCQLHWEWMAQSLGPKGKPQDRCEAVCDRKNPLGFVALVQDLQEGKPMKRLAAFAVAASIHGGEAKGKAFPTGVTALSPGHIAFVIATCKIDAVHVNGYSIRRFGFSTRGALTILHRSVNLPAGCLDKVRWELVCQLRESLRQELVVPPSRHTGTWQREAAIIRDSPVEQLARELLEAVPVGDELDVLEDNCDATIGDLAAYTVKLTSSDGGRGPEAYAPLASWSKLEVRRTEILREAADGSAKKDVRGGSGRRRFTERRVEQVHERTSRRSGGGRRPSRSRSRHQDKTDRRAVGSSGDRADRRRRERVGLEIVMLATHGGMEKGERASIRRLSSSESEYVLTNGKRIRCDLEDQAWRFSKRALEAQERERSKPRVDKSSDKAPGSRPAAAMSLYELCMEVLAQAPNVSSDDECTVFLQTLSSVCKVGLIKDHEQSSVLRGLEHARRRFEDDVRKYGTNRRSSRSSQRSRLPDLLPELSRRASSSGLSGGGLPGGMAAYGAAAAAYGAAYGAAAAYSSSSRG